MILSLSFFYSSSLRRELSQALEALETANQRVDTYKAISQGSEEGLKQLNHTYDLYKVEMEQRSQRDLDRISSLESRVTELQSELEKTGQELTACMEKSDSDSSGLLHI